MQLNKETAIELLHKNVQNNNLRRHCYAVGQALSAYYDYYKTVKRESELGTLSKEQWEIIGILHDSDWELTTNDIDKHTLLLLDWLKEYENVPEELINVFKSHNNKHTKLRDPQTLLEWTLECCDELTGFIVAVTLVRPEKKLAAVEVASVLKKFKQKEFARQVEREQIAKCEEKLGINLDKFVELCLGVMQKNSDLLGL